MGTRLTTMLLGVVATLLLYPGTALASWFQWGTEGSYVHQISHLLFAGAMLYFIYEMRKAGLTQYRGFRLLSWSCWIFVFWNLDAVIGHSLEWALLNPVIMGQGLSRWLYMEDLHTWLFYLFKFDHFLLLLPAFYLFYRALKAFGGNPQPEE